MKDGAFARESHHRLVIVPTTAERPSATQPFSDFSSETHFSRER